jgi:hypothetical protein
MISAYKNAPQCQSPEAGSMNEVRELVATTLNRLGLGNAKPHGEQLVCSDGYDVGIRFAFDGVSAIWLGNSRHIRFVDDAGKLLKVVRLTTGQDAACRSGPC